MLDRDDQASQMRSFDDWDCSCCRKPNRNFDMAPLSSKQRSGVTKRSHVPRHSVSTPVRTATYDRDSGLTYDEFEVSAARGASTWITDYKTPSIVRTRVRPNDEQGARSLVDMALTKLGLESQQLTSKALELLPWVIGEQIWKRVCDK